MKNKNKTLLSLLAGFFILALSLTLFFHIVTRLQRKNEVKVHLVVSLSSLFPELCEALDLEEKLLLDGRFPLEVVDCTLTPSLLRFYNGADGLEFTVPSSRVKDATLVLTGKARAHPFGYALGGVRTVNVGMNITLYGERCKIYGRVSSIQVLTDESEIDFST